MKNVFTSIFFCFFIFSSFSFYAQCFTEQNFTVPGQSTFTVPGTSSESYVIEIEARGADGGDFLWGSNPQTDGGEGATLKGSFLVPGGSDLLVVVGASGLDAPGSPGGGGGGGGSAVIIDNLEVLIAAAAGGGGGQGSANQGGGGLANTNSLPQGGGGPGASGGGGFNEDGADGAAGSGGGAGTLNGQGAGGNGGVTAGGGGSGFGGGGGGSGTGGGGGGGYQGGDGASAGSLGGKGGDSYLSTLYSGTIIFATPGQLGGGANVNGSVIITCIPQGDVEISLVEQIDPLCFDGFEGSIEVSAAGGVEPYQYALNGGTYGDSPLFSGLTAGDYTVTVQDALGSTDVLSVTLANPPELIGEVLSVIDNVCFGGSDGSIEVVGTGGTSSNGMYGYSINGSSVQSNGTFINLPNGFYVITIFDDNQCSIQLTASISSPEDLDVVVVSKTDIICFGTNNGSCIVEAFGGTGSYTFSLDDGPFGSTTQFFDLSGGTHKVTVMDEEQCTEEVFFFINEPDEVTYDLEATELVCYGDNDAMISIINLMGTAPFEFILNDGEATTDPVFEGLMAGEYVVTVIDSAGCEWIQEVDIANPDSLILTASVVMDVQCGGDSSGVVQLDLQNGIGQITYSIDQTFSFTGLFQNLPAGDFIGGAIDSLGCTAEVSFEISESSNFSVVVDTMTSVTCAGESDGSLTVSTMNAIPPIQYSINGVDFQDDSFFGGLSSGTYEIVVIDSSGCTNSTQVSIDGPDSIQVVYSKVEHVACFGEATGVISLALSGGISPYVIEGPDTMIVSQNDTVAFESLIAGSYAFAYKDANGCELRDTFTILQNDSLQLFVSEMIPDSCGVGNTGFVDLNAVGGFAPLTISLNGEVSATGEFDSLPAGLYFAEVVDSLGCQTALEFNIPSIGSLVIDSFIVTNVSCNGFEDGSIAIFINGGEGELLYYVNDLLVDGSFINSLPGGVYTITVVDEALCEAEIEIEIFEPDPLTLDLVDIDLEEGIAIVVANGGTMPYRYSLDDKMTFQDSGTFTGLEVKDYIFTVVDANGCEADVSFILDNIETSLSSSIEMFPIPASYHLSIDFGSAFDSAELLIYNSLGQVIQSYHQNEVLQSDNVLVLPLDELEAGSYFIQFVEGQQRAIKKFIIVK